MSAGAIQVHMERVLGNAYMEVQDQIEFFYMLRLGSGVVFVLGALLYLYSIYVPHKKELIERQA